MWIYPSVFIHSPREGLLPFFLNIFFLFHGMFPDTCFHFVSSVLVISGQCLPEIGFKYELIMI